MYIYGLKIDLLTHILFLHLFDNVDNSQEILTDKSHIGWNQKNINDTNLNKNSEAVMLCRDD